MSDYFVIGATGRTGRHLVDILLDEGHHVRASHRDERDGDRLRERGADPVRVDLTKSSIDELARLMSGCDGIAFVAGAPAQSNAARVDRDGAIRSIDAALAAGTRRFVLLSSIGAGTTVPRSVSGPQYTLFYTAKRAADARLRDSGLDWTIIEPGWLTDTPGTGRITVARTGLEAETTPRADVAATVAAALAMPEAIGLQFELIGGTTPVAEALRGFAKTATA